MKKLASTLSLFSSFSTLICCALPALFVTLGMGATLASVVGAVPQLIWLSERKPLVFGFSGAMLLIAGGAQWRSRQMACPADPKLAEACRETKNWSLPVYIVSVVLWCIGAFFAFVAPWLIS